MIINYNRNCSFIVLATVIMIINYDRKTFILQATSGLCWEGGEWGDLELMLITSCKVATFYNKSIYASFLIKTLSIPNRSLACLVLLLLL